MIKCYLTGIELKEETAYVLDVALVKRIMRELKNRYDGMEKVINELGVCDNVEIVTQNGKKIKQRRRRLLCKQLAEAYSQTYSGGNIFVAWKDWLARTKKKKNLYPKRMMPDKKYDSINTTLGT